MSFESDLAKFQEDAAERGYTSYKDPMNRNAAGYLGSVQLRVTEGDSITYFLNMDVWDLRKLSADTPMPLRISASAQFNTLDNGEGQYVNVVTDFTDFESTEAMFQRMWKAMDFGRYECPRPEAPEVSA